MLDRLLRWLIDLTAEVPMTVTEADTAAQDADREQHRADLEEALHHLCTGAKDIRRKGYIGTASDAYTKQHGYIDTKLTEWQSCNG